MTCSGITASSSLGSLTRAAACTDQVIRKGPAGAVPGWRSSGVLSFTVERSVGQNCHRQFSPLYAIELTMNTKAELLIAGMGWLAVFGLIAGIIGGAVSLY
jgi:hypothetical protein